MKWYVSAQGTFNYLAFSKTDGKTFVWIDIFQYEEGPGSRAFISL